MSSIIAPLSKFTQNLIEITWSLLNAVWVVCQSIFDLGVETFRDVFKLGQGSMQLIIEVITGNFIALLIIGGVFYLYQSGLFQKGRVERKKRGGKKFIR